MQVVQIGVWWLWAATGAWAGSASYGWRADGTSSFPDANPPLHWSADSNVLWKTVLPRPSNASPVLVGKRLFVCAEPDLLLCLDQSSGNIVWQQDNPLPDGIPMPGAHEVTGHSSPTPVSDGKHVYVLFGTGMAAAYDLDGGRKWLVHAGTPRHGWGHSASPLLAGSRLLVIVEKEAVALNVADGSVAWKADAVQTWGSPVLVPVGKAHLALSAGGPVYDVLTGAVVTTLPKLDYNSAVLADDRLYCIQANSAAYAVKPGKDGKPEFEELWRAQLPEDRYYASPVAHDGRIYDITRAGVFSVLNAKTGEKLHEEKLPLGGTCFPSIVSAGRRLFVSSDNGKTIVLKPGDTPEPLSTNRLESFRSTPVFEGSRMYVRARQHLYCISEQERPRKP
jgi:outer membrane protein assembly factor BamB